MRAAALALVGPGGGRLRHGAQGPAGGEARLLLRRRAAGIDPGRHRRDSRRRAPRRALPPLRQPPLHRVRAHLRPGGERRPRCSERGLASWYGRKFHGQKTSSGEVYDMFAMTAAHKTLPIPSYARVTSLKSGQSVVVRVNDRGPFHDGRVIDLSYAAAAKLGIAGPGSGPVEVERVFARDAGPARGVRRRRPPRPHPRVRRSPSRPPRCRSRAPRRSPRRSWRREPVGPLPAARRLLERRERRELPRPPRPRRCPWLNEPIQVAAGAEPAPRAPRALPQPRGGPGHRRQDPRLARLRPRHHPRHPLRRRSDETPRSPSCSCLALPLAALAQALTPPPVAARAYYLLDTLSGQALAAQSEEDRFEPASLTKLMTAYLVFSAIRDRKLDPAKTVPVSEKAWKAGGSRMFIDPKQARRGGRPAARHDRAVRQRRHDRARRGRGRDGGGLRAAHEPRGEAPGASQLELRERHGPAGARPLRHGARHGPPRRGAHPRLPGRLRALLAEGIHLERHHAGQPQPPAVARPHGGRREDRLHRGRGLLPRRLRAARRAPPGLRRDGRADRRAAHVGEPEAPQLRLPRLRHAAPVQEGRGRGHPGDLQGHAAPP